MDCSVRTLWLADGGSLHDRWHPLTTGSCLSAKRPHAAALCWQQFEYRNCAWNGWGSTWRMPDISSGQSAVTDRG